jgi:hypothetical protein
MTDEIAERARKIGGTTLHSVSDISGHQRLADNNNDVVSPDDMLGELKSGAGGAPSRGAPAPSCPAARGIREQCAREPIHGNRPVPREAAGTSLTSAGRRPADRRRPLMDRNCLDRPEAQQLRAGAPLAIPR